MEKIKVLGLVYAEDVGSSHVVRVLEIAKALRDTGHYGIAFSGAGKHMKLVEDAGFECMGLEGLKPEEILKTQTKIIPRFFTQEAVRELFPKEDEFLRKDKPDIIVRSHYRELAGIAAKQYGIFDVLVGQVNVCPYYCFDFRPSNIPRFFEYAPDFLLRGLERKIRRSISKELHRKSKELGLEMVEESYEGADAHLVLLCDSEAVFPLAEKPDKYKYLGPLLVLNQSESPDWTEKFVNDSRKKIVISSGSSGKREKTKLLARVFQNSEFAVAFHTHDISNKIPGGFYGCCDFEVNDVLPYADAFITHGGLGSMYLGLKHGVPMLGLYTHFEQNVNCFTIEKLGAGLSVGSEMRTSRIIKEVKDKTCQLVYDSKYKENATDLKRKLEKERLEKGSPLEKAVRYIGEGYEEFRKLRGKFK